MKKFLTWKILAIIVISLFLAFFDLPPSVQQKVIPAEFWQKMNIKLGLDLQGGSQLDYKIDLSQVPEADQQGIIEGVLTVIEKRVNGLGVSEPNIYLSDVGTEKHIVVELAENAAVSQEDVDKYLPTKKPVDQLTADEKKTVSLEKAKAVVGKTIQLEFKEEKGSIDPGEKDKITAQAQAALDRIKNGAKYDVVAQEESLANVGKVKYEQNDFIFEGKLSTQVKEALKNLKPGEFSPNLVEISGTFIVDESGNTVEDSGLSIVKLVETKEEVKSSKEVDVSHILISYKGLDNADSSVTRTEEEASKLANEVREKAIKGEDFAVLAQQYSDDASNKEKGGKLDQPVTETDSPYVPDFTSSALALEKAGDISEVIHTQFGYHIIKANAVRSDVKEKMYKYDSLAFSTRPDPWKSTGLTGKNFVHADVQLNQFYQPYVSIQFDPEGAKLFEDITGRNINKPVAIFVGGDLISAPRVNTKISGGSAIIEGNFTADEAKNLAQNLNTGAIPAPIILTGETTIGATLGQTALNQSLIAGLIGTILVMLFMILYYRFAGLIASAALAIYAILLLFLIKSELSLGIAVLAALAIFGYLVYRVINSKDPGWEKFLSFLLSCGVFFYVTYTLTTGEVMTLAGIAGIITSIGMAVDANVLIFERFKEELREGKTFGAALEAGFDRAWSSIRDSNFSTLLTCVILFILGSAIVKGFAFTLAAGVLVSMVTALTITKTFLRGFVGKKIAENTKFFVGYDPNKKPRDTFQFIKRSKLWLGIAGSTAVVGLLMLIIFGLNLGLDFKGGSLLELQFKEKVAKEQLVEAFGKVDEEVNKELSAAPVTTTTEPKKEETKPAALSSDTEDTTLDVNQEAVTEIDLAGAQIVESGDTGYIVKTGYLTSEIHDNVIKKLRTTLPEFNEARFTTIGPVVGQTILQRAMLAVILAVILLIGYIAFAFRQIPKDVRPWRFGVSAVIALFHDIILLLGIFALLGKVLDVEMNSYFITAVLTVLGYSINDTIVVFDRIRENLKLREKDETFEHIADKSITQTFARSINTGVTTLLALLAVLIFGNGSIFYFVLALTIGIATGTYSSVFVASPLLVLWNKYAKKNAIK